MYVCLSWMHRSPRPTGRLGPGPWTNVPQIFNRQYRFSSTFAPAVVLQLPEWPLSSARCDPGGVAVVVSVTLAMCLWW